MKKPRIMKYEGMGLWFVHTGVLSPMGFMLWTEARDFALRVVQGSQPPVTSSGAGYYGEPSPC